jgi:hypothetical protein
VADKPNEQGGHGWLIKKQGARLKSTNVTSIYIYQNCNNMWPTAELAFSDD